MTPHEEPAQGLLLPSPHPGWVWLSRWAHGKAQEPSDVRQWHRLQQEIPELLLCLDLGLPALDSMIAFSVYPEEPWRNWVKKAPGDRLLGHGNQILIPACLRYLEEIPLQYALGGYIRRLCVHLIAHSPIVMEITHNQWLELFYQQSHMARQNLVGPYPAGWEEEARVVEDVFSLYWLLRHGFLGLARGERIPHEHIRSRLLVTTLSVGSQLELGYIQTNNQWLYPTFLQSLVDWERNYWKHVWEQWYATAAPDTRDFLSGVLQRRLVEMHLAD